MHYRHRDSDDDGCRGRRHARDAFDYGRHDWRGGHHGRRGHGGRPGRFFDQGDLRFVLLQFISDKPRHGYELIKAIEEKFGGMYSPSPGVIYPTLTLLEELGHVQQEAATGTKKLYSITSEGAAHLEANRAAVDAILARMGEVARAYGGGPAPEILRAMQNLKYALSIRLGRGPLDQEQVRRITATLDRAVTEIEQS